jgi:uracil-DNA glycosylase
VFLLWGNKAHESDKLIDEKKHLVIKEVHPSPLAGGNFVNSKCFSQCNAYLKENKREPINWNL